MSPLRHQDEVPIAADTKDERKPHFLYSLLSSRLSSDDDTFGEEAEEISPRSLSRSPSEGKYHPIATHPNVDKSEGYNEGDVHPFNTLGLINHGKLPSKAGSRIVNKFGPHKTGHCSFPRIPKAALYISSGEKRRSETMRSLKFVLFQVESKVKTRLKNTSQNLRKKIPECFQQKYFKRRKRSNFDGSSGWKGLNRAERVLKSRLKRFCKFRKSLRERLKSQDPVFLPADSEHPGAKSGRSFESKGEDFSSSKKKSMNPKRSSLPNLFWRGAPKHSTADVKSSSKSKHEVPYRGLQSSGEKAEEKPAANEEKGCVGKSSQSTIKLIDKLLERSASLRLYRSRGKKVGDNAQQSRSLSMEDSAPFSAVRKSEIDSFTKKMSKEKSREVNGGSKMFLSADEPFNKDKSNSPSKQKFRPLARESQTPKEMEEPKAAKLPTEKKFHRPTTLFIKSNVPSIKLSCDSPGTDESDFVRMEGFSSSLDSARYNKNSKDNAPTSDLLKRLDSVLSEIVEQEKKKIQKCEKLRSNRSADNLFLYPSQRQTRKKPRKHSKEKRGNLKERESYYDKLPRKNANSLSSSDLLSRHQSCFTEQKLGRPRIVKSDSQPKLLSMRCYQPPRPKHNRKRVLTKRKSFDDRNQIYQDSFDESSPASESDSREIGDCKDTSRDSFEEEFSSLSASSAPAAKEAKAEQTIQADDEDDTCYGSDYISSDMVERGDSSAKGLLPHRPKPGECSIDSAYTESREETPDFHTSDRVHSREDNQRPFTPSYFDKEHTSLVQLMNESKRYLLDKIRDSRSYSDKNINQLLAYYSKKWKHIPEREMKIVVRTIRSDLGVRASPKECIEFLYDGNFHSSSKGSSCQDLNRLKPHWIPLRKEVSKEDILADLTTTLPEYLKTHQWNRKTLSTSSSPEPYSQYFSSRETPGDLSTGSYQNPFRVERMDSPLPLAYDDGRDQDRTHREDANIDEEWIKKAVGEATYKEMESIINEIKTHGDLHSQADPKDFEKIANEICKQFSITF